MAVESTAFDATLGPLVKNKLKPFVKKIDAEAYYAVDYLRSLGQSGLLQSRNLPDLEVLTNGSKLVETTARTCMTTSFNLWCHLAALTYLRNCDNPYLLQEILPLLEDGTKLAGTGLSNPMKYYAGMERLNLKARQAEGGYVVSGQLGAVSNLGSDHWFGMIAELNDQQRIMAFVACDAPGLLLKEKADYLGLNGSATYSCQFNEVFVPNQWIIAEDADTFVRKIRTAFVAYQVPLGLGVIDESIRSIEKVRNRQSGCNSYLNVQADELETEFVALRDRFYQFLQSPQLAAGWDQLLEIRLEAAYLTLKAVQAGMLHQGSAAYLRNSDASRRLREAYFFANLTPTVKHLEKLLHC